MRRLLAALCAAAAAGATPRAAHAQADANQPEPVATPPATDMSRDGDAVWRRDYGVARERLLAGDFADAAARFDKLVHSAQRPSDRALAEALRDVAASWSGRGLALVRRNDLGESNLPARSVNERTTDEIAQLYASGIIYGVGTGLWVAAHTQPASTAGLVLPILLFAGVADGTVAVLDIGHPLHYGVAQSTVTGMNLGFEEGLVLSLWNQSQQNAGSRWSGTTVADALWALSTVGAVGGGVLGTTLGSTPGRASFVGSAGLWSGVLAGLAAAALTGNGGDRAPNAMLAADAGLNAGILGGLYTAGLVSPSIARVRFLDIGGIGGGLVAGGLYVAAADRTIDAQALAGVTALGIAGGLALAWVATSDIPADRPEERRPSSVLLEPMLVPVQNGATLGVAGAM
jgi:hypothetical protein